MCTLHDPHDIPIGPAHSVSSFRASACPPRRAVAFQESGMEYINLGEREVLARYRANGQMSYIPGIWDPVWSRGQVGNPRVQRAAHHESLAQRLDSPRSIHSHFSMLGTVCLSCLIVQPLLGSPSRDVQCLASLARQMEMRCSTPPCSLPAVPHVQGRGRRHVRGVDAV
jgi:hypothetical protein